MKMRDDDNAARVSKDLLESLFGPGSAERLRDARTLGHANLVPVADLHNAVAADTRLLSLQEHYLIGMSVLLATGRARSAQSVVKLLRHVGMSAETIREAASRLTIWCGGLTAMEMMYHVDVALKDYEAKGVASFPCLREE